MSLKGEGKSIDYSSMRIDQRGAPAEFQATWNIGEPLPQSTAESLEFFLTERFCLYSYHHGQLFRSRIFHSSWPLRGARLDSFHSTMIEALGIPPPAGEPLLQYAESIAVDIWPLKRV